METFEIDRRGDGTVLVTITRPEKLNAMNHAFFGELPEVMRSLDDDPGVRAAVLTGAGQAFSAGGDIADFHALDGMLDYRRQVKMALEGFLAIERAETPMIAAVNGLAFGGGTEITLACDIAMAAPRARFAFKEITLGLMPGYGLVRAPGGIGRAGTHGLTLSGEEIAAARAWERGLVQPVSSDVVGDALPPAAGIAAPPPLGLRVAKRFINR